jgi:DNA polymerase III delta' subunit
MTSVIWRNCAGQHRIKEVLEAAIANNTLGHAYLFSGETGCGKFAAAMDLSLALLCEKKNSQRPCLTCSSCQKVLHYSHPDFHVVMPLSIAKEHKDSGGDLNEEGWKNISDTVRSRLENPYLLPDHAKVPEIPVEWIRETNHTILRGPLESAFNVVIMDGAEMMNKYSANSMLKVLEEPRAGTLILLLTNRISSVLPTIVSRCQILRFSWLSPTEIREELVRRLAIDTPYLAQNDAQNNARLENVLHTGSLGRSLELWNTPQGPDEELAGGAAFWDLCVSQNWPELATLIDRLGEWHDFSRFENLFLEMIARIRNTFLSELPGTENVFLGDRSRIVDFAGTRDLEQVEKLSGLCQSSIAAVKAHANSTLVLANFAIALTEALHGEKQQPG